MTSTSSDLPADPEPEQSDALYREFLDLGFTMTESRLLAEAWAVPAIVEWRMAQGCSYRQAVRIYS